MNAIALAETQALLKQRGYEGWSIRQQRGSTYDPIAVRDNRGTTRWFICVELRKGRWHACDGTPRGISAYGPTAAAALDAAMDTITVDAS